jgi:hypothetical protein
MVTWYREEIVFSTSDFSLKSPHAETYYWYCNKYEVAKKGLMMAARNMVTMES